MKKFAFSFMLMLLFTITAFAQSVSNDVRLTAGVSNINYQNEFVGSVEVRKTLSERFGFVGTGTVVTDGDTALVVGQPVVRFAPIKSVFVGGGAQVGKAQGSDVFVNPVAQAGLSLNAGRFNFEPFVQLETPDLASKNPNRTLSGNLAVKFKVTEKFGLIGTGALRSTRTNNEFFEGTVVRVATGGFYFNF